jgi:phosphoribosylglycinamide formyltransferase 1
MRVACPPFKHICFLGVDVNRYGELVATNNSIDIIRRKIKADSLGYLSMPGLKKSVGRIKQGFCTGCFDAKYPVEYDDIKDRKNLKNIAVFISNKGSGSNLQSIINNCNLGKINGQIKLVISDTKTANGLTKAKDSGIETLVHPLRNQNKTKYYQQLDIILQDHNTDLIVLAGWKQSLCQKFINKYKQQIIQLHPAMMADNLGGRLKLSDGSNAKDITGKMAADIIKATLKSGASISGATTYFITSNKVEWGPVIMRVEEKIETDDSVESYYLRLKKKEHAILPLSIKLFCEDKLKVIGDKVEIIDPQFQKHYSYTQTPVL